jgi:hypothetical protein
MAISREAALAARQSYAEEISQSSGIRRAVGIATMKALADMCRKKCATPEIDPHTGIAR